MSSKTLTIKELVRFPEYGSEDHLIFTPGVNLIIGPGNSGKTKWLCMLDYLFGDSGKAEEAFPISLVDKYDSIKAIFNIDNDEFTVERRWKEKGSKGKVFVEGDGISTDEFQQFLTQRLKIPIIHFPKGNPYTERKWPELSWRILLRHIYRQQRFWADIADQQPEGEQHAAIMQFLGMAEHLFSGISGELVQKRKELWKLQGGKEQYILMLDRISKEITDENEFQVALTDVSVNSAITRIKAEIESIQRRRDNLLTELKNHTIVETANADQTIDKLSTRRVELSIEYEENIKILEKLESRLKELDQYEEAISIEISKLERSKKAENLLSSIKVTNCPVCDKPINLHRNNPDQCYLCGQLIDNETTDCIDRIEVEIKRLKDEKQEGLELISKLSQERDNLNRLVRNKKEDLHRIEEQLIPVRQETASIISPEIGVIDMEIGRFQERVRQLERIKIALDYQKEISKQIDILTEQIGNLEVQVKSEASKVRYSYVSDLLSNGMNTYVNALNSLGRKLWMHDRINLTLREKDFCFTLDGENWTTKLGGTSILYFLLSYHYGLLSLSNNEFCHYPGFLILDIPATFLNFIDIRDKENFIAEPFISLTQQPEFVNTQVIITGSAFEGLNNVNRIEFTKIWE